MKVYDMLPKSQNVEVRGIADPSLAASGTSHQHPHIPTTINELLGAVLSNPSTTELYTESPRADRGVPVFRAQNLATFLWRQPIKNQARVIWDCEWL